jgi:hypothetical protein
MNNFIQFLFVLLVDTNASQRENFIQVPEIARHRGFLMSPMISHQSAHSMDNRTNFIHKP